MISGHIECELAVLVVLCVLSIFLFPCAQGPYPAVHGPVTALLAVRAAGRLRLAMFMAAMALASSLVPTLRVLSLIELSGLEPPALRLSALTTILRC